jgi:hypothetical protein
MEASVWAAIIAVAGAALSFYLTKYYERKMEWQREKINHYKVLVSAISDLASCGTDDEANKKFFLASNTIALVAPQNVIKALMILFDETKLSNPIHCSQERHDKLLKELLLAIRKDIGLSSKDDPNTFYFHLIGSKPA